MSNMSTYGIENFSCCFQWTVRLITAVSAYCFPNSVSPIGVEARGAGNSRGVG